MLKIRMLIADSDGEYLKALSEFLSTNYGHKFTCSYYTKVDALLEWLGATDEEIDIILISRELFSEELVKSSGNAVVILNSDYNTNMPKDVYGVQKYSSGEVWVSDVLCIYSELRESKASHCTGQKNTSTIAFFSAAGGVGKTTLALSLCRACISEGIKVFYLNLEPVASTLAHFDCSSSKSISEVFHHIREGGADIISKLEGLKSVDIESGIHFFGPPTRFLDFDEVRADEQLRLIELLRETGTYDMIVVDFASNLDKKTMETIASCSHLYCIVASDRVSLDKDKAFKAGLKLLGKEVKERLSESTACILNKSKSGCEHEDYDFVLPYVDGISQETGDRLKLNLNNEFGQAIYRLLISIRNSDLTRSGL